MSKEVIQAKPEDISKLLYEVYDVPSGICEQIKDMVQRLEAIDNLMKKYEIEDIEDLEAILADYDDMAKDIVEMGLGVKVILKGGTS